MRNTKTHLALQLRAVCSHSLSVIGLCLILIGSPACTKNGNSDELLRELDTCVTMRPRFHTVREHRIDSLRTLLHGDISDSTRFEIYGRLVEAFRSYDLDSQLNYTQKRLRMAATPFQKQVSLLNYSEVMMRNAMYHETLAYMDSAMLTPINPVLLPYYYHLRRTLFGLMDDFAVTDTEKSYYCHLTQQYRDSMMCIHPCGTFLHELVRSDALCAAQLYDSALVVLDDYEHRYHINSLDEKAVFAVTRAQIYRALGNTDMEKKFLAISAVADLKNAVREYIALRDLALLLYKEGDVDRAFRYMQCAVQDASVGSARVRSIEIGMMYPIVEKAYLQQVRKRQFLLTALLVSILFILFLLTVSLIYVSRQRKKQAVLNEQLKQSNADLQLSNHIQTVYVGRYMEMASLLIDRFDNWRKSLKTLARKQQFEELTTKLDSQKFTQEQLSAFYHDFDEAFLNIFPDFVDKVKDLLVPEAEFRIKPGEKLNTDLRVLACIRLGITDSTQIASFLRLSLPTIYNSRTRMRNFAKEDRKLFEQKVTTL